MKISIPCQINHIHQSEFGTDITIVTFQGSMMRPFVIGLPLTDPVPHPIALALPAKVTLTIETADESVVMGEASAQPKIERAATVPSDEEIEDSLRVAALAASKAMTRCAEAAADACSGDIAESWARAANALRESIKRL